MTRQLELGGLGLGPPVHVPEPARARHTDPPTSHMAAKSISQRRLEGIDGLILKALRDAYPRGMNNHEIVAATGLAWNVATPRMAPLSRDRLVEDTGEKVVGPKGKKVIVWKALE